MCTEANVVHDGKVVECGTVGQLAAALRLPIRMISDIADTQPDDCLCNANWEALGARRATEAEGWPFPEYIIPQ